MGQIQLMDQTKLDVGHSSHTLFCVFEGQECPSQFTRTSTNSITGPVKGRSSTPKLWNSQENTVLQPDFKNQTLVN